MPSGDSLMTAARAIAPAFLRGSSRTVAGVLIGRLHRLPAALRPCPCAIVLSGQHLPHRSEP